MMPLQQGGSTAFSIFTTGFSKIIVWTLLFTPGYISYYLTFRIGKIKQKPRGRVVFAISLIIGGFSLCISSLVMYVLGSKILPGNFDVFFITDGSQFVLALWTISIYLIHVSISLASGLIIGNIISSRRENQVLWDTPWSIFINRHLTPPDHKIIRISTESGDLIHGHVSELPVNISKEGVIIEGPKKIVLRNDQEYEEDIGDEVYIPGESISHIWTEDTDPPDPGDLS